MDIRNRRNRSMRRQDISSRVWVTGVLIMGVPILLRMLDGGAPLLGLDALQKSTRVRTMLGADMTGFLQCRLGSLKEDLGHVAPTHIPESDDLVPEICFNKVSLYVFSIMRPLSYMSTLLLTRYHLVWKMIKNIIRGFSDLLPFFLLTSLPLTYQAPANSTAARVSCFDGAR